MMTSLFKKKPKVIAKTARRVSLTASEVAFAKENKIPLAKVAKAKLPKRGRPVGSKNKPKPAVLAAKNKAFKQPDSAALQSLMSDNLQLIQDNKSLLKAINSLEHQIVGFRAVISYLENRLGLVSSQ